MKVQTGFTGILKEILNIKACRAGIYYLHCELNYVNAEKSQPNGNLNPKQVQRARQRAL